MKSMALWGMLKARYGFCIDTLHVSVLARSSTSTVGELCSLHFIAAELFGRKGAIAALVKLIQFKHGEPEKKVRTRRIT